MNLSQLLELTCAKPTKLANDLIKKDPANVCKYLSDLSDNVLQHLGNDSYVSQVQQLIKLCNKDISIKKQLVDDIINTNLYIEVPSFTKLDLHKIPHPNEDVVIPKKTIDFMKNKLDCFKNFIINEDVVLPNIFVGPMYIQKLHKIANKLTMARDLGPLKSITQQPVRGRAKSGGASLGQMEIEAIIANGCETALTELLTVKNDWNSEKKKLMWDLISTGKYNLPQEIPNNSSRTKTVVNTILKFLKS